jgi:hypothetical protein
MKLIVAMEPLFFKTFFTSLKFIYHPKQTKKSNTNYIYKKEEEEEEGEEEVKLFLIFCFFVHKIHTKTFQMHTQACKAKQIKRGKLLKLAKEIFGFIFVQKKTKKTEKISFEL